MSPVVDYDGPNTWGQRKLPVHSAFADSGRMVGKPYLTGLCQGCPFLSGVGFRPQSRLGRVSKDRSFESDDLMFWDVRPGLCRDVVPLAHESF